VWLVRKQYLLYEAFELTGRRLFGNDWNGYELGKSPVPSPEELARARLPYLEAYQQIEAELSDIDKQVARSLSASEIEELNERRIAAQDRLQQATSALNSHPEPTESTAWLYETYQRKVVTETTLIEAIKRGTITVNNGRNWTINNLLWSHPHFGYDIELSVVRLPRFSGMRRFQPAWLEERQFDSWLLTLEPLTESARTLLSRLDQCRLFLDQQVAAGGQAKSKKAYLAEAQDKIKGLTAVDFNEAWKDRVPDWTAGGRRKWPEQSSYPRPKDSKD
jgi:phosphoglycerate-specific signal transduction histidine kinase